MNPSQARTQVRVTLERDGFALDVDVGWDERVAVLFGPSGSGKSTLFDVLLGLAPQANARVRLAGEWLEDHQRSIRLPVEQRGLGWVPQDPTLFPHLSVADNIAFASGRGNARDAESTRAIDALEIGPLLGRNVAALSGGERQRVAIARALAAQPRALLLDEPLAALDVQLRARVLGYLLRVRDEWDIPILYITHDPDEALLIGDVTIVLDGGRVVASGPPREVMWSRAVLPLSESLGLENVIEARAVSGDAPVREVETAAGLRLTLPETVAPGERLRIGLRAQDILLARERPGRISARNAIRAQVVRCVVSEDGDAHVHLDAGEPLVAKITEAAIDGLGLEPGVEVYAIVKAQALRRLTL
jgi:molybdate transport system ATP-binding protein